MDGKGRRKIFIRTAVVSVLLVLLLSACSDPGDAGRSIGEWIREFTQGLWQGCFGMLLLPLSLLVWVWIDRARRNP